MTVSPFGSRSRMATGLVAAVATAVVLTGCSSGTGHTGTQPASSATHRASSAAAASPGVGAAAAGQPGALTTITGTTLRVPSGKPSVLAFISVGCADCAAAAKAAGQASHTLAGTATVLAVDLDPGVPASALNSFLDYVGAKGLPVVVDTAKFTISHKYAVTALSSVLVVNPAGKVTYRAVNPSPAAIVTAARAAA